MFSFKEILISFVFTIFVTEMGANFTNHKSCGITSNSTTNQIQSEPFIVGGRGTSIESFPFMVSLQFKRNEKWQHFCGGSILNSRWILTAAHCIKIGLMLGYFDSPRHLRLIIGQTNNGYDESNTISAYKVEKWVINGCFMNNIKDLLSDDIALLKTTEEIDFNRPNVKPICLPPKNGEPNSTNITIAGWGTWTQTIMFFDQMPDTLQVVESNIESEEFCQIYHYFRNIGLSQWPLGSRICIRQKESTGCRGDSGGPAFQKVNGKWVQFGIASFISTFLLWNRCYKSNPILYLKTSHYIDWISQSIQKYSDSTQTQIKTKC